MTGLFYLAAPSAVAAAEERDRQEATPCLVGDLELAIARIGEFIQQPLYGRQRLGRVPLQIGKLDPLIVFIDVVAVTDVEEKAGHGISASNGCLAEKTPLRAAGSTESLCSPIHAPRPGNSHRQRGTKIASTMELFARQNVDWHAKGQSRVNRSGLVS